jgi:hypothetical protein
MAAVGTSEGAADRCSTVAISPFIRISISSTISNSISSSTISEIEAVLAPLQPYRQQQLHKIGILLLLLLLLLLHKIGIHKIGILVLPILLLPFLLLLLLLPFLLLLLVLLLLLPLLLLLLPLLLLLLLLMLHLLLLLLLVLRAALDRCCSYCRLDPGSTRSSCRDMCHTCHTENISVEWRINQWRVTPFQCPLPCPPRFLPRFLWLSCILCSLSPSWLPPPSFGQYRLECMECILECSHHPK